MCICIYRWYGGDSVVDRWLPTVIKESRARAGAGAAVKDDSDKLIVT